MCTCTIMWLQLDQATSACAAVASAQSTFKAVRMCMHRAVNRTYACPFLQHCVWNVASRRPKALHRHGHERLRGTLPRPIEQEISIEIQNYRSNLEHWVIPIFGRYLSRIVLVFFETLSNHEMCTTVCNVRLHAFTRHDYPRNICGWHALSTARRWMDRQLRTNSHYWTPMTWCNTCMVSAK